MNHKSKNWRKKSGVESLCEILMTVMMAAMLTALMLPPMVQAQSTTNSAPPPAAPDELQIIPGFNLGLTNLPLGTNFQTATFAIGTGVASENSVVANYLKFDWYLHTNWALSGEFQMAPVSTTVENASIYAGYRKPWQTAELMAQVGLRRNFAGDGGVPPSWQGGFVLESAWFLLSQGKLATDVSLGIWSSSAGAFKQKPDAEVRAGFKGVF